MYYYFNRRGRNQRMKLHNRHFSLQFLLTIFTTVFLLLWNFADISIVEAAKPDKIAPTAPTNLRATAISDVNVTLVWNSATDNTGVKGYDIYQNNKLIGNTTSTQYSAQSLSPKTTYSFYVKARDNSGNISSSSNVIQITTATALIDTVPQVSSIQVTPISNDGQTISGTVSLSVAASDDKGISKVEFYSNNGGYLIKSVTAEPYSVNWATDPWVPDGEQILKAVVYDTANQTVQTTKTVIVKNTITSEPNSYKKVGYYTSWSTYSNYQVSQIDASKLTHVNYAFANISADGKIALGDSWADIEKPFLGDSADQPFKGNFYQLSKLKLQYPNLKTLISVGGWTWSERFSDVSLTEQSRTIFADSLLQFILKYNFNGVDLDWEYPVGGGEPDNINRPEDKQNFTLLLKKIRETFDAQSAMDGKEYLLTIAGGAGSSYAENTQLSLIQQYVDYIQLMTYDIHGSWDSLTGLNAPLFRDPNSKFFSEWSVQDAVRTYLNNGVQANKLVMGVPFYGRIYNQVYPLNSGLYQSFAGGGSALSYSTIETNYLNQNGFIRYWQSDSKVPWLFNGTQFISYDDEESIGYKTDYIKSMGLGGAMMWELSQDPNRVLITKINNDLQ